MTLEERVRTELLAIRKSATGLAVATLSSSPVISALLGNGDPQVAYNALKHAILHAPEDTSLLAATSSLGLSSDKPTHLGRLEDFGTAYGYDQRQVRRYSDKGLRQLAKLITSSWAVESSPCLDVLGYQTGPACFAFMINMKWLHVVEMQPVRVSLKQGGREAEEVAVSLACYEDGLWNGARVENPIQAEADVETSLRFMWRGELWPKFIVQWRTELKGLALVTESLGNTAMIRILPDRIT